MKTVNGKNKLERQINKAKKYLNIELVESSNKYLKIKNFDKENTFIIFNNFDISKNGEWALIRPVNKSNPDKPFFKKEFGTINGKMYFHKDVEFCIFKSFGNDEHNELLDLAKGFDDVYLLSDWIEMKKEFLVEKN